MALLGQNRNELASSAFILESDDSIGGCEQAVVATAANVLPRLKARSTLPDDNRPTGHHLATVALNPESLGIAITAVTTTALTLLCAIVLSSGNDDLVYAQSSVTLAMTYLASVALAALLLEGDHLAATPLLNHSALNTRTSNGRVTHLDILSVRNEVDRRYRHFIAYRAGKTLNTHNLSLADPVLFPACFNNCVHLP